MPETQLGVQEKRPDLPTPVAPAWDSGLEAIEGSPGGSAGKESTCYAEDLGLIPGSERSPGGENGTPVFLPGKSFGQRILSGYSPWGSKESDMTEHSSKVYRRIEHTVPRLSIYSLLPGGNT